MAHPHSCDFMNEWMDVPDDLDQKQSLLRHQSRSSGIFDHQFQLRPRRFHFLALDLLLNKVYK